MLFGTITSKPDVAPRFWVDLSKTGDGLLRDLVDAFVAEGPDGAPATYSARLLARAWKTFRTGDTRYASDDWSEPPPVADTLLVLPGRRSPRTASS